LAEGLVIQTEGLKQKTASEPFAIFALAAAIAGGLLLTSPYGSERTSLVVSAIVIGSLMMMVFSPSVDYVGLAVVYPRYGLGIALALALGLSTLNWVAASDAGEWPPPRRRPAGGSPWLTRS
jgi:hypothetical protein